MKYGMAMVAMMAMAGGMPDMRKPTEKELDVEFNSLPALCEQYNLIQQKKSKLTRAKRDMVESKVLYYSAKGKLFIENGKASIVIKVK